MYRKDWSSAEVPSNESLSTTGHTQKEWSEHDVPSTSCTELLRKFGVPDVLKIDIEGGDSLCVADVCTAGTIVPRLLVVELPFQLDPAIQLLGMLQKCGYQRCKLTRQSAYHVRCWPGKRDCLGALQNDDLRIARPPGAPESETWTSSDSMTMVGLMGSAAVDFLIGTRWHDIRHCFNLLQHPVPYYWFYQIERFDLHVQL